MAFIKEDMVIETVDTVSNRIFTIGKIYGMPCVCVKAGIGKVNAAMTAEILILKYSVDCKETGHFPEVIVGRIVTGDQFISSEEKRKWIEQTFHADCVEMEGAAVAQVCVINQVPFVIIRCLSDIANETADIDFEEFVVYAAKNSSLIVNEMIKLLEIPHHTQ